MIALRLATVLEQGLPEYARKHRMAPRQWQVCCHVLSCRTEALGETTLACDQCGYERRFYRACRDRHCPRCQRQASLNWSDKQCAQALPVTYHHVVFTLPHTLNALAQCHARALYDQVLKSTWQTLRTFAQDKKRLNGQLGATLVLHTWGQTLVRHIHVHCLVPAGAWGNDGTWHAAKSTYLFPVRALARVFRGHCVAGLRARSNAGELNRIGQSDVTRTLDAGMAQDWNVYSKPCLSNTATIVDYLARYSHRTALTDGRLLAGSDGQVGLRYRDYRDEGRQKQMTMSTDELIRRYLLHVLPKGFMRIRHCGFLANRCRVNKLREIREALNAPPVQPAEPATEPRCCPRCRQGRLQVVRLVLPSHRIIRVHGPPRHRRPAMH